jgi:Cytochrome c554 and c-prime
LSGVILLLTANIGSVSGRASYRWHAFAAVAVYLAGNPAAKANAALLQTDQFIGAAGCKSSSCHGGAGEKRSQYLTWVQQDFHSRAYAVLVNARSARMAETLALPVAQTSARCTVCHSPLQSVAPSQLTKTAQADEGVSCENCHGAAGQWLRGHTRKDWTYAMRVGAGMRDLRTFYVRANTCVACHQNLDADLLAAGHPELTFELDGQSVAEPKHWRDEDPWNGPRAWLVGQAVALREMSWSLANSDTPDADATARWNALVWLLAKTTANQTRVSVIETPDGTAGRALFATTQNQADLLARQAATIPWDEHRVIAMLHALVATESDFVVSPAASPVLLFRRAQRLVLALDRLIRATNHQVAASDTKSALSALFEDVRARPDFQPAKFAADLASFRTTTERAP